MIVFWFTAPFFILSVIGFFTHGSQPIHGHLLICFVSFLGSPSRSLLEGCTHDPCAPPTRVPFFTMGSPCTRGPKGWVTGAGRATRGDYGVQGVCRHTATTLARTLRISSRL